MAIRSLQEQKMRDRKHLVGNAGKWLGNAPLLQEDVMHLHRIGAVPTYRGTTPPLDRVRGLPHNPADTLMMSVLCWERGSHLFLGVTAISEKKKKSDGMWPTDLLLLGYQVNLKDDSMALPEPKILAASNLIHLPVFDYGNLALDLHALQELRGCLNHWSPAVRVWRWLVEPVNGLLSFADNTLVWIRCADMHRWWAFWNVICFLRDLASGAELWQSLFVGVFSELLGVIGELSFPKQDRRCVWFSGDAANTRIGGINWDNRTYFPSTRNHSWLISCLLVEQKPILTSTNF